MRAALGLVVLSACATATGARAPSGRHEEPPPSDGGVAHVDSGVASGELAWLVAHLAEDPDPANPRESDAVRRLSAMGTGALRAVVEVFRVGDARRAPFARRVFERHLRRACDHSEARVTRALAVMQGRSWDGGATARWEGGDGPWPQAAMERAYAWIDAGARCDE